MHNDNSDEGLFTSLLICTAALTTAAFVVGAPFFYAVSGTAHVNIGLAGYKPPVRAGLIPSGERSGVALVRLQPAPIDPAIQAFAAKANRRAEEYAERRRAARAAAERHRAVQIVRATERAAARDSARDRHWAMQPRGPMYQPPIF